MHLAALKKSGIEPEVRIAQLDSQPFGVTRVRAGALLLGDGLAVGVARDAQTAIDCLLGPA